MRAPAPWPRRSTTIERDEPATRNGGTTSARSEAATAERQSAVSSPLLRSTLGTAVARPALHQRRQRRGGRGVPGRPRQRRDTTTTHEGEGERARAGGRTRQRGRSSSGRERQAVRRQQVHARGHQCCKCDLKSPSVPCELVQNTCGEGGLHRRFGRGHFIP